MRLLLWVFMAHISFFIFAEEKKVFTYSKEEIAQIESQHKSSNTKKFLKDLENYESYRPDPYSDATRNPFQKKRYQFHIEER